MTDNNIYRRAVTVSPVAPKCKVWQARLCEARPDKNNNLRWRYVDTCWLGLSCEKAASAADSVCRFSKEVRTAAEAAALPYEINIRINGLVSDMLLDEVRREIAYLQENQSYNSKGETHNADY